LPLKFLNSNNAGYKEKQIAPIIVRKENIKMSKVYTLKTIQKIPVPVEKAWDFFSSPANLVDITPGNLGFNIISKHHGEKMYPGQIIEYKVSPVWGIPIYWMTEITHVEDGKYFVDEQRFGPYSLWHHQHHFAAIDGGVEMTDIVHYKLPFWLLGDIAQGLFVKQQLKNIFDFRFQKVEKLFGVMG
jgi:ligand-binding SRPBCC domain-containing protein